MNRTEKRDYNGYLFLREHFHNTGVMPSHCEISQAVGYAFSHSVPPMLCRLEKRGFISYSDGVIEFSTKRPAWPWTIHEPAVAVPIIAFSEDPDLNLTERRTKNQEQKPNNQEPRTRNQEPRTNHKKLHLPFQAAGPGRIPLFPPPSDRNLNE